MGGLVKRQQVRIYFAETQCQMLRSWTAKNSELNQLSHRTSSHVSLPPAVMSGLNHTHAGCQSWSDATWASALYIFAATFQLVWSPLSEQDVRCLHVVCNLLLPINYTRMCLSLLSTREQSNSAITIITCLCLVDMWHTGFLGQLSQFIWLLGADFDQMVDDEQVYKLKSTWLLFLALYSLTGHKTLQVSYSGMVVLLIGVLWSQPA